MRSLGVDIGERSIKVIEIEFSGKSKSITGAFEIERSAGDDIQAILAEFFQSGAVKPDRICVGLGNTPVFVKQVDFPFSDRKKVEQALLGEFDDVLPIDIEDHIVEFQKIKKAGRSHTFLSGIIAQKHVEAINQFFDNTSVIPNDYCLNSEALARLGIEYYGRSEKPGTKICICDIGFKSTDVAIVEIPKYAKKKISSEDYAHSILELRTVGRGIFDLYSWLDKSKAMSHREVDQWLLNRAEIKDGSSINNLSDETSDEIKTAIRPLLVEIYQTIQAFSSKFEARPNFYLLTGRLTQLKGFEDFFAQELRSHIVHWDAFHPFDLKQIAITPEKAAGLSTALALANRYGDAKSIPWLNFRRSSHATKRVLSGAMRTFWSDEFRPILLGLFLGMLTIVGLYFASIFLIGEQMSQVAANIRVELKKLRAPSSKTSDEIIADPSSVRTIFEKFKQSKMRENILPSGSTPRTDILHEISTGMPSSFMVKELGVTEASNIAKVSVLLESIDSKDTKASQENLKSNLEKKGFSKVVFQKSGKKSVKMTAERGRAVLK